MHYLIILLLVNLYFFNSISLLSPKYHLCYKNDYIYLISDKIITMLLFN